MQERAAVASGGRDAHSVCFPRFAATLPAPIEYHSRAFFRTESAGEPVFDLARVLR